MIQLCDVGGACICRELGALSTGLGGGEREEPWGEVAPYKTSFPGVWVAPVPASWLWLLVSGLCFSFSMPVLEFDLSRIDLSG